MIARLQKSMMFAMLVCALAGWWCWYPESPALAWAAVLFFPVVLGGLLALQMLLASLVGRTDPTPRPHPLDWLRAWAGEGWAALQVFAWRQPFRANALPDRTDAPVDQHGQPIATGQRGVVFIHGFMCNRGFWTPWMQRLQRSGHAYCAVSLEPVWGSIDDYMPTLDAAVGSLWRATGQAPMLVCHSMGGLAVRAWLRQAPAWAQQCRVVTIGTPHRGTWLARFGHSPNGRQMRVGSDWQMALASKEPAAQAARFVCWYSACDNIVFPPSTATLPGADNRFVRDAGHVQLAFLSHVISDTLALLQEPDAALHSGD